MGVSLENIRKDIRMRTESDPQMSTAWLLVYLFPVIVSIVAAGYTIVSLLDFISSIDPLTPTYNYSYDEFAVGFALPFLILGLTGLINFVVSIVLTYLLVTDAAPTSKDRNSCLKT